MTLGLGVLLALFLLAPGLALHAAIFRPNPAAIRFAPPPPGSVSSLSIIAFGSLVGHVVWSLISAANDAYSTLGLPFVTVDFEPNIYTTMLETTQTGGHAVGLDAAAALSSMLLLSGIIYGSSSIALSTQWGRSMLRPVQYGWLSDFVSEVEPEGRYATAFILTPIEHDGVFLGYEGFIENISVNSDKEITAISLLEVNRFTVTISPNGVQRKDVPREAMPRLYLDRENIRNISLTIFEEPLTPEQSPDDELFAQPAVAS
jgi:hypothetical protein